MILEEVTTMDEKVKNEILEDVTKLRDAISDEVKFEFNLKKRWVIMKGRFSV